MSLNTSHANGGVLIFSGERWNLHLLTVSLQLMPS